MYASRYICRKCGTATHTPKEQGWYQARVNGTRIPVWFCQTCAPRPVRSVPKPEVKRGKA